MVFEPLVHSLDELVVTVRPFLSRLCLESLGECLGHTQELVTLESRVSVWVSPMENLF